MGEKTQKTKQDRAKKKTDRKRERKTRHNKMETRNIYTRYGANTH